MLHADIKQMAERKKAVFFDRKSLSVVSKEVGIGQLHVSEEDAMGGQAGLKAEFLEEEYNEVTAIGHV